MQKRLSKTLPTHPTLVHPDGSRVQALGVSRSGRLIWPVRGGAPEGDGAAGDGGDGDGGKGDGKAAEGDKTFTQADLDRIVNERLARAKPKDYDDLKAAKAELDKIKLDGASDLEKAVLTAKKETEDAVRAELRRERVLDRVEVLAAKDFADAEDARLRLEKSADEYLTKDGQPDADAIKTALAQLLKDKPHLSAKGDGKPKGNADQGHRENSKQESRPGVSRMRDAYAAAGSTT